MADLAPSVLVSTSHSRQRELPEWQRALLRAASGDTSDETSRRRALVDEECPKCHHEQMFFYTMQLRSADEGQTVFYECPKCRHTFSVNS